MARKRQRIDIIRDMLSTILARGGEIKPTHLMYQSNLAHGQMKGYLEDLISKEIIRKISREEHEYIIITDRGIKLLKKLKEMEEFEKAFGI